MELGVLTIVIGITTFIVYAIWQTMRTGKKILQDPQIRAWLQKEQDLETRGEWQAGPKAGLVLPQINIPVTAPRYPAGQVDIAVASHQAESPITMGVIADYIGQPLIWKPQYQHVKLGTRTDLVPVQGGPTLAIVELHEPVQGGVIAQMGDHRYIIYQPDLLPDVEECATTVSEAAVVKGMQMILSDGRVFKWEPSPSMFGSRSVTDENGVTILTFHHLNLYIDPQASPEIVTPLVLLEYFMYANPLGD